MRSFLAVTGALLLSIASACSTLRPAACIPDAKYRAVAQLMAHGTFRVPVRGLSDLLTSDPDTGNTSYFATVRDRQQRCRCCILVNTKPSTGAEAEIDYVDIFVADSDRAVVEQRIGDFLSVWRPEVAREDRTEVAPRTDEQVSEVLSYTIRGRTYHASRDFDLIDHVWTGHLHLFSFDDPTAQD